MKQKQKSQQCVIIKVPKWFCFKLTYKMHKNHSDNTMNVDLAVDQNLESGRRMIFSRAEERGGCTCKVLQRSSKSGSKEVLVKYQVVSSEYVVPGPHGCEGLYTTPDAWPLVPDFSPRYVGPENQVTTRTWSNQEDVPVTSRWFGGGG